MRFRLEIIGIVLLIMLGGCKRGYNRLRIVNYKSPDRPEVLTQEFKYAYFDTVNSNNYRIILKSEEPVSKDENQILQQIIFIKLLWQVVPGRTYANSSQINAKIDYIIKIMSPENARVKRYITKTFRYRGSGFVFFRLNWRKDKMTGSIEDALLNPVGKAETGLGKFILSGKFKARYNPSAVAETLFLLGKIK